MADTAWCEVDTTTIRNCWCKASILPSVKVPAPNPTIPISSLLNDTHAQDPIVNAEKAVQRALDSLESKGVLHHSNRMDIEALLNPASEILDEATDEEIFQAVVDTRKAQDELEITGGDDVDDDAQIEVLPTRCEVLKAVSVISNYVNTLNDPFARKLEAVLGSFRHDLHLESSQAMVSTQLTDYFH